MLANLLRGASLLRRAGGRKSTGMGVVINYSTSSSTPANFASDFEAAHKAALASNKEWRVMVSAVVERIPIILPDAEKWEEDFLTAQSEYRDALSREYTQGFWGTDDSETKDDDDDGADTIGGFMLSPRETEADATNNFHSLNRQLSKYLYLLIKSDGNWHFPTSAHEPGSDAVINTLSSLLVKKCGTDLKEAANIISSSPSAFDWGVDNNGGKGDNIYGTKDFFYNFQISNTEARVEVGEGVDDFAWVTVDALGDYVGEEKAAFYRQFL